MVGKLPIKLPQGVTVTPEGSKINVSGPKGTLSYNLPKGIVAKVDGSEIRLESKLDESGSQVFGTTRANIANMVLGVENGFTKEMELVGTGYRAEVSGDTLVLSVGYSHPVKIKAPEGITFKVEKTIITIEGIDKEMVGQIAAKIRQVRPPEPYQGKGIKYKDEKLRRKAGKAAKTVGTPGIPA